MLGQRLCCLQPTVMLHACNDLNDYLPPISETIVTEFAKSY